MKTLIQIQDEVVARFMVHKGGIFPQTTAAAWRLINRELQPLGFNGIQIARAYDDCKDMAYLFKLCNGELN